MRSAKFSKIVIFTVCILLVFAVAAALLFDGASLPAADNVIAVSGEGADWNSGEYPAVNYGYQHGTNIDRSTSGASAVSNETALRNALNGSGSYYLTQDITLSASNSFDMSNTFSGTLYGNGHTVTVTGNKSNSTDLQTGIANATNIGGLVSKLSGKIYDLNVVLKSGTSAAYKSASSEIRLGLIAGVIDGGTIENCTVTISSGSNLVALSASAGSISTGANTGGVAGNCNGSMTIKNVTVINNGTIAGAVQDSGSATATNYRYGSGNVAMFVGFIWNDQTSYTQTMNNIIAKGGGTINGYVSSILGTTYTTTLALTVNNYYNQYTGGFNFGSTGGWSSVSLVSYTLFKWSGSSDSSKVVNYYHSSGTNQSMMSSGYYAVPDNSITVSATDYTVYFDPRQEDLSNSLAVVKTGVTGGQNYTASITTNSGTTYSDRYSFSDDGGTVIFRRLPMAISNWGGNNGTFACTINITQNAIDVTPLDPVNKWESSYTTSQSSSGTAVDNGSKLTTAINNNQNIYLTRDITDFRGFTHTGTYSGTLDGNGRTIYIVSGAANSADTVGGLFGTFTGTIKNVRIVLYSSYNRTVSTGERGTGIVAGVINGGTVDNVYVYIPEDVTFGATGNGIEGYVGAIAGVAGVSANGKVDGANYTIKNTTVDIDGKMHLDGSYVYLAGFVGKTSTGASAVTAEITNCVFKGNGSFASASSNSTEPIYLGGTTVLFQKETGNPQSTIKINGFINAFKGGDTNLTGGYSMYGVLSKNDNGNKMTKWTTEVSSVYDYNSPWGDINKKNSGNDYIDISDYRSTVSTTVADTSIAVTPYFPAGDTTNLVLVAGDGTSECPFVTYESYEGVKDGNYMVVSIPKTEIAAQSNVQLIQGKPPVNEPSLATTEENLVYNGGEITISINQLMSGTTALGEGDYTLTVTVKEGGTGSVQNNKPVNAGDYTLTVTLLNGYEFADGTTEKTLEFTVTPFEISGTLSISTSAVYDKTEKTVIFTADDGKGLFGGDNVVISYNGGDRINVTEVGFTATATVPNANYTFVNSASSIEKTFKITAKELTVVWGETSFTYDGSEKVPTAEVTEGIIEGDSATLSVSGAVAAAGQNYTATATISPENANYTLTNDSITFVINKAKVSVSGNNATAEYKAAEYTEAEIKAAVFTNGLPDDATTNIAVSPESVINASDSATVTVTLKDGNNYEFEAGATTQFTFTVVAKEISLPEGSADNTAVYNPLTTYTAAKITELIFGTASVENVTVKVMNGDVEISGDTSISNAGVYTVTATANENYVFVADTVTQYTFEITKAPITLGVSVADWIYGNQASAPVITGNDGNGAVTYLYKGDGYSDSAVPTKAGTYSLEITVAETVNYQGGKASCEFTIEKAVVTVPTIEDKAYTGEILTADIADTDEYEVVENNGGRDVATYDVVIRLKDAANYKWSDGTETAEITLEFNIVASGNSWINEPSIDGWTYGETPAQPQYQAEKGHETAVVEFKLQSEADSKYRTVEDLSKLDAGAYNMRVSVPKTEDYGGLSMVVEFTVEKAAINVTVDMIGWTYGEAANNPVITGNVGSGAVTYLYTGDGYSDSAVPTNAGTYSLEITVAETVNYQGGKESCEFTIAKKAITATVSAENATYDGIEHAAAVSFDDKLTDDELTASLLYNGEAEAPVNAGSYTVTVGSYGGAAVGNYEITTAEGEVVLVISPKELTIDDIVYAPVDESDDGIYDGEAHAITASVNSGSLCGEDVVTLKVLYNGSEVAPVDAKTYEVTFEITDNANYAIVEGTGFELTVAKAKVSVSGADATAVYTGEAFAEDEIIKAVFGEADLSLVNVVVTYRQGEAAVNARDIADISLTLKDGNNYEFAEGATTSFTFTVVAEKISLEGQNKEAAYKGEAFTVDEIKNAVFGEGTWADFVIEISYNNGAALNAGDVATVNVTGHSDGNYAIDTEAQQEYTFTVVAKDVTLKAETSVDKTYDGKEYDFSGYVVSGEDGFYDRDNVTVTVSAGTIYTPGSYGITVSHDANGNYNVTVEQTEAKLTINKAVLTVTAKDAEIEYTGNIIAFEFDITAGRVGEDDVQIDGVTYKQNGVAVAPQETGTYDVTFTLKGANAAYYTANATQVKVTPQTATAPEGMTSDSIVLPADDDMIYDGEAHVAILDYTATDGNTYGIIYHNGTSYVDEAVNADEYTVHVYKNTKTNIVVGISKTMTVEKKILLSDDIKFTSGGKLSFTYSGAENVVTAIATGVKGEDVALTTLYDGGDKAPVDAGKYTVTFASANGNYAVDESVSYNMTVAKANVNAPKADELVYNGSEQIAFSENSLYTAGGIIAATDVSEEGYTATFTLTSDNYKWSNEGDEVREISVKWNITPAPVTITVSDAEKEKVYDGAALTPEELAALFVAPDKIGGGKVEIVVTVKDGGEVLSVGVYTVTAKLNDINYVADKAETTFTVTQAAPAVTVKVQDKLLQEGDKLSTVGIYLEEGSTPGTVSWDNTELALEKGENVVTWTYVPEDTQNYTGDTGSLTLTVGDEVLTAFEMTKGPDKTEYNAFEAFDPTGIELMATFDGVHEQAVAIDECEIVVENATADGKLTAATAKVTVKYGNMSVEIAVSVAKIKVEIPALEQTEFEYTAQPHTVTVAEDPRYAIVKGNEETNVGKYNAVVSLKDKVNYEWADGLEEDRMLSWEITPVTLSGYITLPENLVYDGVAKVATFTLTKGELLGGATMNIAYELTDGTVLQGAPVDAGVYEVVATLPDTKNYRFEEGTEYCKAMTVEKKTVTIITIGSREKVYDGSEVTPEQLAEHFSATDGITVKVTASGTVLNAGTYQITATIEEKNYRAEPVSCTYTVRKASQTAEADISVGYLKVEITAADKKAIVEYSEDGNVWKTLDGAITVGLKATYTYYVRYAESANYNASAAVKVEGNITKAALMQYVEERFTGDITLADAADVAMLEELAKSAEGQNADFDKVLESLSAQREELVNGATNAVEKALKAGGALKGYAAVATALAITVGGISAAAAVGLMIGKGKGGKKNEEK